MQLKLLVKGFLEIETDIKNNNDKSDQLKVIIYFITL